MGIRAVVEALAAGGKGFLYLNGWFLVAVYLKDRFDYRLNQHLIVRHLERDTDHRIDLRTSRSGPASSRGKLPVAEE